MIYPYKWLLQEINNYSEMNNLNVFSTNVKGMLIGNAKLYTKEVIKRLNNIGYKTHLYLLDSSKMGLPQIRERVFFVSVREDIKYNKLDMCFNFRKISTKEAFENIKDINTKGKDIKSKNILEYWNKCKVGESFSKYHPKGSFFSNKKIWKEKPCQTLTAGCRNSLYHYESPRILSKQELCVLGGYPLDYDFMGQEPGYIIGMSVPPLMMANIGSRIYNSIFKK